MRMIDADALAERKFPNEEGKRLPEYVRGWNDAIDGIVDYAPTIDAVPKDEVKEIKQNYIDEISGLLNRIDELTIDAPSSDTISRADAIAFINSGISLDTDADREYATDMIKALPSADAVSREFYEEVVKANHGLAKENSELKAQLESAEAVQGEWVIRENGNKECSLCGHERQDGWDYFCGYCGARMKGGDSE